MYHILDRGEIVLSSLQADRFLESLGIYKKERSNNNIKCNYCGTYHKRNTVKTNCNNCGAPLELRKSIITKRFPYTYGDEMNKYKTLLAKVEKLTSIGNVVYTSMTSGVQYNTRDSFNGIYYNKGEAGLLQMLYNEVLIEYVD